MSVSPYPSPHRTLSDLGLPHACREVIDKVEGSVLSEIEQCILHIAVSILEGAGFQYAIPNRSKGNQLYVPGERRMWGLMHWVVTGAMSDCW